MNNVTLLGRLTKDPELKYTNTRKVFCRFNIAVPREFNKDETDFINCVAWEKKAEVIAQYFKKGNRILISGSIITGSYQKDGQTFYATDINVTKIDFIDYSNNQNTNYSDDEDFPF